MRLGLQFEDILCEATRSIDTADPEAVESVLGSGGEVQIRSLPVLDAEGGLLRLDGAGLPEFLAISFGLEARTAVDVLVLNGNGAPRMGEEVARLLVPEGFRVVASRNARSFDRRATRILVAETHQAAAAERVRDLIGVGKVIVGVQGSGLADLTIIVGRDFLEV